MPPLLKAVSLRSSSFTPASVSPTGTRMLILGPTGLTPPARGVLCRGSCSCPQPVVPGYLTATLHTLEGGCSAPSFRWHRPVVHTCSPRVALLSSSLRGNAPPTETYSKKLRSHPGRIPRLKWPLCILWLTCLSRGSINNPSSQGPSDKPRRHPIRVHSGDQ